MKKYLLVLSFTLALASFAGAAPRNFGGGNIDEFNAEIGLASFRGVPDGMHPNFKSSMDLGFETVSGFRFAWNQNHHQQLPHNSDFDAGDLTILLSNLQAFLVSHDIDSVSLKDLRSWLGQLRRSDLISKLENCFQPQIIDNGAIGTDVSESTNPAGTKDPVVIDQVTAVPEPSTLHSLICGLGLLGGVLLRLRSSR